MTIDPRKLAVMVEAKTGIRVGPVTPPCPSDVLYAAPNRDGSRKLCGNCALWAEQDERCLLFGGELPVQFGNVCGYHVYGEPQAFATALSAGAPQLADPATSGLEVAPVGGTACDNCQNYDPRTDEGGLCRAVWVDGRPAPVQALGCCARWRPRDA